MAVSIVAVSGLGNKVRVITPEYLQDDGAYPKEGKVRKSLLRQYLNGSSRLSCHHARLHGESQMTAVETEKKGVG